MKRKSNHLFLLILGLILGYTLFLSGCSTKEVIVTKTQEVKVPVPQKCNYSFPILVDNNNSVKYILNLVQYVEQLESDLKQIPCLEIVDK